eukprot:COSAG04_NODE_28762_length_273_cov_1.166667_1_plen_30_part_01
MACCTLVISGNSHTERAIVESVVQDVVPSS